MALWGDVAAVYGAWMAGSAIFRLRGPRRWAMLGGALVYAGSALGLARTTVPAIHLFVPAVALLSGYWLSGPFFDRPQPWLERWLLAVDRRMAFIWCWTADGPRWVLEALEGGYAAVYLVVAAGALLVWPLGVEAIAAYWTVVLSAELACYAALPWIRTRPPRALEPPGPFDRRPVTLRLANMAVVHRASVQANTLPSGHVAGAVAAALAVSGHMPLAGAALTAMAMLIGFSAIAGRYHYLIDVVLGWAVAIAAAWMFGS